MADLDGAPTAGRTVRLRALPRALREGIALGLRRGSDQVLARGDDPPIVRASVAVAFAIVAFVLGLAVALRHFADTCGAEQAWPWGLAYAAATFPILLVAASELRAGWARRGSVAPGVYVTESDIAVVSEGALRIVPGAAVVGVSERPAWLRRSTQLTLWLASEPSCTLVVPVEQVSAVRAAVEQVRAEAAPTGYRLAAETARDPLADVKRADGSRSLGSSAPLGSSCSKTGLLAVLLTAGVASGLLVGRNLLSFEATASQSLQAIDFEGVQCLASAGPMAAWYVDLERDGLRLRDRLEERALARAAAERDYQAVKRFLRAYPQADPALRRRAVSQLFDLSDGDLWRLRAFVAAHPDSPEAEVARTHITTLSLGEAITRDDVQIYAYVARESAGTSAATEASRRRAERYARVLDALAERHGATEAVAFFRELVGYLEAHELEEVAVRIGTRVEGPEGVELDALSQARSELREVVLHDRVRAAFAEILPRDVLPITAGRPLPRRSSDAERVAIVGDGTEAERAERLVRLVTKEDDDTGRPEIRIELSVVPGPRWFVREDCHGIVHEVAMRFDIELRTPTDGGAPRRLRRSIEMGSARPECSGIDRDLALWPPWVETGYDALITARMDRLERDLESALFVPERPPPPGI